MSAYLITFLLFFLSLIVIPIGISPFETPKVILAETIISILLIIKLFKLKKKDFKHFLIYPQLFFIGILFILSLDTQLLFRPQGAFFGNVFRLQGQFLFWNLLTFALISKSIKLDKIPKVVYYFSFILLTFSTLILGVNGSHRAFGTLGEPNALAATALFIFPFVWFKSKSSFKYIFLAAALAIILLSGSRAGMVGLTIELVFILSRSAVISILLIILSLGLPFISPAPSGAGFENRTEIWQTSLMAGLKSPLIGHGFGNIQKVIHKEAVLLGNNIQYQVVDSSHNFLLDFWIQGGLVGVISILILIYLAFQRFIKHRKLMEMASFLGIIAAMSFNPVSVVNLLAFWWLIGYNN